MRIPRLYVPIPLSPDASFILPEEQSHYIGKVLRMKSGDQLILFNGEGGEYDACLTDIQKKSITVQTSLFRDINNESTLSIHLGLALSKGDRMDFAIQKSTELGVSEITPIISDRTELKLSGDRLIKKVQHWQKIAISACEQCSRHIPPTINTPISLNDWLTHTKSDISFVLHHRTTKAIESFSETPNNIALLIGPEGGLTVDEISLAEENNFNALRLGPRVMRTETAPIAAISILQYRWGDI